MHEIQAVGTRPRLSWLFVRRQKRALALRLAASTAAEATRYAHTAQHGDRLRVRVHAHGRVWCRPRRRGRDSPPYFIGELRDSGHGTELTGTIRESRESGFLTSMYTVLALLMAAVAVFCAASAPIVSPGLVICGGAAIAFGVLAVALRRQRPTVFPLEADALTRSIARRFGG